MMLKFSRNHRMFEVGRELWRSSAFVHFMISTGMGQAHGMLEDRYNSNLKCTEMTKNKCMWQILSPLQEKNSCHLDPNYLLTTHLYLPSSQVLLEVSQWVIQYLKAVNQSRLSTASHACTFFHLTPSLLFGTFSCSCTHPIQFITVSTGAQSAVDFTFWIFIFMQNSLSFS